MPSAPTESNTTSTTPTIATAPEAKSPLVKTTNTELTTTQLYIEGTVITNDTQLAFQEHKVQQLISKQIDLEYGVADIFTMLTIIIALGGILTTLTTHFSFQLKRIIMVILFACLGFGSYGYYKQSNDPTKLNQQIVQSINAIDTYKKEKK